MTKTRIYRPVCRHYFAGKHDWATNNDTASNHHSLNSNLMKENIERLMKNAIELSVPMEVGIGHGANWLEAH